MIGDDCINFVINCPSARTKYNILCNFSEVSGEFQEHDENLHRLKSERPREELKLNCTARESNPGRKNGNLT